MAGRARQSTKTSSGSGKESFLTETNAPESEIFRRASVPDLNPYPILEIDSQGSITYLNPAAAQLFPDIHGLGADHPIFKGLAEIRTKLKDDGNKALIREVEVGGAVYEEHFYYVPDTERVRIYARNVTGRKKFAQEMESHYRELQTLHEIGQVILNSPDLKTIMPAVLNKALQIGPFDIGVIRLLEPGSKILKPVAMWGYRDLENLKNKSYEPGDPRSGMNVMRVMTDKGAQVVEDVPASQGLRAYKKEGVQSAVVVPVRAGEEVLGTFQLGSRTPRRFRPQQISLLEAIGSQVGIAAQKARLFEEVKKNTADLEKANRDVTKANIRLTRLLQEQSALREIFTQINLVDMGELLKKVAEHALTLLKVDHVQIRLLDKGGSLRRVAIAGKGAERLPGGAKLGTGRSTWVLENCKTLAIKDISQDKTFGPGHFLHELGVKGYLVIPLISREQKPIGVIGLSTLTEREFTPDEIALGEQLASGAAVAIENAKLYEESEKQQKIQTLLKELNQDIAVLDTDALFKRLSDRVREFFSADICDVRMTEDWQPMGVSGIEAVHIRGSGGMRERAKWITENRKPLVIPDMSKETDIPAGNTTRRLGIRGYLAVPLFSRNGTVIGILRALTYQPREFAQEEVDLLQQLANGAALSLENAKLFHDADLRAKEQAVLNTIAVATSQSLDLKRLLESALERVLEVTGKERGFVRLKDPVTGNLALTAHQGISEEFANALSRQHTLGEKTAYVFKSGLPLVVNDVEGTLLAKDVRIEGNRCIVWIPLMAQGKVVGILNVSTSRPIPFAPREVELLQAVGNVIGVAVENARLFGETRRSLERVRTLREIDQAISSTLDVQAVLDVFLEKITLLFPYRTVTTVRLLNKERGWLEPVACSNLDAEAWKEKQSAPKGGLAYHVFDNSAPLVVHDLTKDPRATDESFCRRHDLASYLGAPLIAKGECLGVLGLYTRDRRRFTDDEVDLLSTLAGQAALAIQNSQLYEQTSIQAVQLKNTNKGLERREEIQKLLKEVSQDVTSLDIDSLLKKLTEKVREFFDIDISDVRVVDSGIWRQLGVSGVEPERLRGKGNPRPRANWVIENRKPLVVSDMTKATDLSPGETTRRLGVRGYVAVPLFSRGGQVIGILRALSYKPREFAQEEIDLLQQLANGAAVAIENARLFMETEQRAREQAVLNAIAMAISQSLDLKELLQTALDKVLEAMGRERGFIRFKDPVTGDLALAAHRGISESYAKVLLDKRTPGGKSDRVFESGEPLVVNDTEGTLLRGETRDEGNTSIAWIPLKARGEVVGILNVSTSRPIPFTPREVELLQAIGNVIGVAVENARLFGETERSLERVRAMREIDQAISSTLHLETVLNVLLEKIDLFHPDCAATIRLFNAENGLLEPVACRNLDEQEWKGNKWQGGRGLANAVFETKAPILVRDARTDPRVRDEEFYQKHRLISYLGVPLIAKDHVLGVLNFYTRKEHDISDEEIEFLSTIAGQAAIAIYHSQLYERLQKQAMELERANKVKDEFLSVMSHELRTPLNVVVGYTEMMREHMLGKVNQEQQRALGKVIRRSKDLLDMIDSVLQATNIEAKTVKVESCEVPLGAFLGDLKLSYDIPLAGETSMAWHIPSNLPSVKTDPEKLKRILQSLIHNAIKFTSEGRITIAARYFPRTKMVKLEVTDTGIGIPHELQPVIFEMFRQGDSSETRPYGGVGLGLYIAKRLTEMLGGTIGVKSRPGKGSTFTVAIPCEKCQTTAEGGDPLKAD